MQGLFDRTRLMRAADALAIALCHIQAERAQARMAVATMPGVHAPRATSGAIAQALPAAQAKSVAAPQVSRAGGGSRGVRIPVQGIQK